MVNWINKRMEKNRLMNMERFPEPRQYYEAIPTQHLNESQTARVRRRFPTMFALLTICLLFVGVLAVIGYPLLRQFSLSPRQAHGGQHVPPTPTPFDPNVGAVLPTHRVVAFYAIPNAEVTGPAYHLTTGMLADLQAQAAAYEQIDPAHPVQPGIDLVVSIPDGSPGPAGTYSHHLDPQTIQDYINFCQKNGLILFLDLDFGWAPVQQEVNFFLPYLERYSFVEMAIDPEWMFPRHDGIPGINLTNVRASDLNPVIQTLAELPMKYHVPRKI